VLDITLVKGKSTLVSEWRVLKTQSFSNHRYIQFRYDFKSTPKVTVYGNSRNTNWEKFTRTVTSKLATSPGVVKSVKDIETSLETLSNARHQEQGRRPPWWNREMTLKRNNLRGPNSTYAIARPTVHGCPRRQHASGYSNWPPEWSNNTKENPLGYILFCGL